MISKQAQDDLIPVDALQAAWASCSDHEGCYPFRIYGEVAMPFPLKRMMAIPYGEEDSHPLHFQKEGEHPLRIEVEVSIMPLPIEKDDGHSFHLQ